MEEDFVPASQEYRLVLCSEMDAEIQTGEALFASAKEDAHAEVQSMLSEIETAIDLAQTRIDGMISEALTQAETAWASVELRLKAAMEDDLAAAYSALRTAGAMPHVAMPYILADLERGDAVASGIETILAPIGYFDLERTPAEEPVRSYDILGPLALGAPAAAPMPIPAAAVPDAGIDAGTPIPAGFVAPPAVDVPPAAPRAPEAEAIAAAGLAAVAAMAAKRAAAKPLAPVPATGRWTSENVCDDLARGGDDTAGIAGVGEPFAAVARSIGGAVSAVGDSVLSTAGSNLFTRGIASLLKGVGDGIWDAGIDVGDAITKMVGLIGIDGLDKPALALKSLYSLALSGTVERLTSAPMSYLSQHLTYDLQYSSPQFLPSQAEIDTLYVTNRINRELWECWTRAQGNIVAHRSKVIDTIKAKPDANAEIQLWLRGAQTAADLDERLKQLGYMDARDREALPFLAKYVPSAGDIVTWMARDVFDPKVVAANGLAQEFNQKLNPQAREAMRANGMTEDDLLNYWCAHWGLPSPTQGFEMLHRLRPGRVPPGVEPVTRETMLELLGTADLAPGWRERMVEVSYATINKSELLNFYIAGSMAAPEVLERLQDVGHNLADATAILNSWTIERARRQSNEAATWTVRKIGQEYQAGTISMVVAFNMLSRTITDKAVVQRILDECDEIRAAKARSVCIASLRKRYLKGEFTLAQTKDQLALLGMAKEAIDPIANSWLCTLTSMDKQPALGMLRKWYHRGTITLAEVEARLRNLHYTPADTARIIADMVQTENERAEAAFRSAIKQRIAAKEKAGRMTEKAAKEFESEIKAQEAAARKMLAEAKARMKEVQAAKSKETAAAEKKAKEAKAAGEKAAKAAAKAAKEAAKEKEKADKKAAALAENAAAEVQPEESIIEDAFADEMETTPEETDTGEAQPEEETGEEAGQEENAEE